MQLGKVFSIIMDQKTKQNCGYRMIWGGGGMGVLFHFVNNTKQTRPLWRQREWTGVPAKINDAI